ncbi:MAG: DNA-methyltransferase [Candidatus Heimdallarchaeota archaeon]
MSSFSVGDQRVYLADASKMLEFIKPESVQLMVTSPPYWNVKDYGDPSQIGFGQSYEAFIQSLNSVWEKCNQVLKPNGKIAVVTQPIPVSSKQTGLGRSSILDIMTDVHSAMRTLEMDLSNIFIWDKRKYNNQRIFGSYPYPPNFFSHLSFEFICVFRKRGKTESRTKDEKEESKVTMEEWSDWCFNSIWDIPPKIKINSRGSNILGHIAPFPEEIPYRLIRLFTFKGDVVLDPFLGSGTTLQVCRITQRRGIGFEIVKEYADLIKRRISEDWTPPGLETAEKWNTAKKEPSSTLEQFLKTEKI